ncbi:hypothetical protein HRF87_21135 [Bacillus sp. CRN 9]|nr:hypothetical protein [Bacillus sp. CRN 9]
MNYNQNHKIAQITPLKASVQKYELIQTKFEEPDQTLDTQLFLPTTCDDGWGNNRSSKRESPFVFGSSKRGSIEPSVIHDKSDRYPNLNTQWYWMENS